MKRKTLLFTGLLLCKSIFGQVTDFQKEFNSINENLMLSLGSYAVANFAISGAAYFSSEDEYLLVFPVTIASASPQATMHEAQMTRSFLISLSQSHSNIPFSL